MEYELKKRGEQAVPQSPSHNSDVHIHRRRRQLRHVLDPKCLSYALCGPLKRALTSLHGCRKQGPSQDSAGSECLEPSAGRMDLFWTNEAPSTPLCGAAEGKFLHCLMDAG